MEESTTQTPKPNELDILEGIAYAMIDDEAWEVAEFLMAGLEPIKLEDLDPNDRVCAICQEELFISEHVRLSHAPVKTVCGHIFGNKCIIRWLDPLCNWDILADIDVEDDPDATLNASQGCPMCRQVLLPRLPVDVEPIEELAHRLSFWDMAYASAGVARSEKEERARKYLWQYVEYWRLMDEDELDEKQTFDLQERAQLCLRSFVKLLNSKNLAPEQENLRKKLEQIGRKDLRKCPFENHSFVFNIDRDDNERIECNGKPLPD